jgi:ABC-type branched-subunit amino acid transport system ATPase component
MSLLSTSGLSMAFGGLRAVQDLDFAVARGEVMGLIGPNGSGKTTVFNVITGLYRATAARSPSTATLIWLACRRTSSPRWELRARFRTSACSTR